MERKVKKVWVSSWNAGVGLVAAFYGVGVAAVEPPASEPKQLEKIVIKANPLRTDADNATIPVSVLSGERLLLSDQTTLGVALEGLPGVRADTFGAGASRPIIRGQTAPRVVVLQDGADVMDASGISPDHALTVDPMLADRIEVIRGPGALLYSAGAIGGVVNVVDSRIPDAVPVDGVEGFANLRGASGARERAGAVGVTAGEGNFAIRLEGSTRHSDDYRVPDWSTSRLPGSFARSTTGSIGASWFHDNGYTGLSFSQMNSRYGLPGHDHGYDECSAHDFSLHCDDHDEDHEEEGHDDHDNEGSDEGDTPVTRLKSQRFDARGEYSNPLPGLTRLSWRAGFAKYRHDEMEHDEIAGTFKNRAYDLRLELAHAPIAGWEGVFALQNGQSRFDTAGPERFLPSTHTKTWGVALLETYRLNDWRFEVGMRHDWQSIRPDSTQPAYQGRALSGSAAAIWEFAPAYSLALQFSRAERMPGAQELYADGVHLATNTYEIGQSDLGTEKSTGVDLTLRKTEGDFTFEASVFYNRVKDYIYAQTLDRYEDFRLIRYAQQDAQFVGLELDMNYQVNRTISVGVFGDVTRGRLTNGGGDLPRIPAARLGGRINAQWQDWRANLEVIRVLRQDRIAAYEIETPGYTMLNAGVAYDFEAQGADAQVYLQGRNLLNRLAFNHSSYLAQVAPLPGRSIMLGVRVDY
ncbi:TonB-dependent receptor [Neopusillimonas maritima]|uniref:TonB-dependent receptor n=1 Tax=Neopusillimonas maritima TaxID=2026239 RepID=A0ABX9MVA5_9BURK|nr:TonB-dependent receptor [Neopusillimonas maritima]